MFSKREGCCVGSGKGVFLFLLRNLAAGYSWHTSRAILGLILSHAVIHCIRQNGFDFGCLIFKFYVRGGFFCCSAVGTGSWPERVIESAMMFLLVSKLFQQCRDLEINSFRMNFLNIFLERGKMGGQVGYI